MTKTIMTYNADTGALVCYAPPGEEVFRDVIADCGIAHRISNALTQAYQRGVAHGYANLSQRIGDVLMSPNAQGQGNAAGGASPAPQSSTT
jgi:hypothetical protein